MWPGVEFGNSGLSVDEEMDGVREILLNTAVGGLNFKYTRPCTFVFIITILLLMLYSFACGRSIGWGRGEW